MPTRINVVARAHRSFTYTYLIRCEGVTICVLGGVYEWFVCARACAIDLHMYFLVYFVHF